MIQTWNRFLLKYFNTHEVESSRPLQAVYWALVLGFFLFLQSLIFQPVGYLQQRESLSFVCPEYFRSCSDYFFLQAMPWGFSYQILLTFLCALLFGSAYFAVFQRWGLAQLLLVPLFLLKAALAFFQSTEISIPFETYHLLPCFIFIFCRYKGEGLRWAFVILYVLSGLVKLDEGWIAGSYFSALKLGLPLVSTEMIPLATNFVILMELVGAWLLLSERWAVRFYPFVFFVVFHLFSIVFVGLRYPSLALPYLLILYGRKPSVRSAISPLAAVSLIFVIAANIYPFFRAGDHKVTYEGMTLAMNMFDANRQVISKEKTVYKDGTSREQGFETANAFARVVPYRQWFRIQNRCQDPAVERVEWTFDAAKNGGPFRRWIEESNACALTYDAWKHNEWIRLQPPIIGYPDYNFYHASYIHVPEELVKPQVYAEPRIQNTGLEMWLRSQVTVLSCLYASLGLLFGAWSVFTVFRKNLLKGR